MIDGPSDRDTAPAAAAGTATGSGGGLSERVRVSIDDSLGISQSRAEWAGPVAVKLVDEVLGAEDAQLWLDEAGSVEVLSRSLYRMCYEAALACEYVRQMGSPGQALAAAVASGGGEAGASSVELSVDRRLGAALDARGDEGDPGDVASPTAVGQLARPLCLCIIDAYGARDRYDYRSMTAALDACDHWVPAGYTLKSFRVLEVLRAVARAGLSRDGDSAPPTQKELAGLSQLMDADRGDDESPYYDFSRLLLITAIGHMQRSYLVKDAVRSSAQNQTSLADWALTVLGELEDRGTAAPEGWPMQGGENPVAHHVHFYRYFMHHIRAMALADQMKQAAETQPADADDPLSDADLDISPVRDEYRLASASLERALNSVPPFNEARWRYYDLSAENLEHEESLRLELLEQRLRTRRTVKALADDHVKRFAEASKEDIRDSMTLVSMRVVEIIGVFLAVVTVLGSTIASATLGDISFTQRIVILAVGGTMPVIYFVLLRWIVSGTLRQRGGRAPSTAAGP